MKNWRKMLEEAGGYENELVGIPAGGVQEMVEEIEALLAKVAELESVRSICQECGKKIDEAAGVDVAAKNLRIAELEEQITAIPQIMRKLAASQNYVQQLRNAINRTLDENGHLADGDNCTLIELKRAIESVKDTTNKV